MAAISWPSGLPDKPLQEGYSEKGPKMIVETQMDAGPPKARTRFTAAARKVTMRFFMTNTQKLQFDDFYVNTLGGGALRFNFTDPSDGEVYEWRVSGGEPEYTPSGPNWVVNVPMLRMV